MDISIKEIERLAKNNNLRFYLDIDGVLWNSVEVCTQILDKKFNTTTDPRNVSSWNFSCCYDGLTDTDIEELFADESFFDIVKFQDGTRDFMNKHMGNIVLVTKGTSRNIELKRKWFDDNGFDNVQLVGLPLFMSKDTVDMSDGIFIDDSVTNLTEVTTAKHKFLFKEYDNYTEWSANYNGLTLRSWK